MLTYKDRKIPETLAEIVTPSHTAVIVHDMQKDNIGEGGAYDKVGRRIDVSRILPSMVRFLEDARAHRARVMYTQYTNLPDWGAFADVWVRDLLLHPDPAKEQVFSTLVGDTPGWPTVDALAPRPGEIVIRKYRVDAFIATPVEYLLRLNKIRTIIHTGIATEVGILPTAWHALNLGFFVVVPEDCVGPMHKEFHEDAMRFLRRLAVPTTSADIVRCWGSKART
jgi:nicotinamidase-related amidase